MELVCSVPVSSTEKGRVWTQGGGETYHRWGVLSKTVFGGSARQRWLGKTKAES